MFNPFSTEDAGVLSEAASASQSRLSENENIILAFHNAVQSVVLLKNALKSIKKDGKNKYLEKVLTAREATKRASIELVKQQGSAFETTAEKYLFVMQIHNIADNSANIASILAMSNVLFSSSTKKFIQEILMDITDMAKEMDFQTAIDTKDLMRKIKELRQLIYDQQDRSSYLLMEKVVDSLQNIIFALDKLNEF